MAAVMETRNVVLPLMLLLCAFATARCEAVDKRQSAPVLDTTPRPDPSLCPSNLSQELIECITLVFCLGILQQAALSRYRRSGVIDGPG